MKDNQKLIYLGLAFVVALAFGIFMYKRLSPSLQNGYDPKHVGPPGYAKSKTSEAYGATVGGSKNNAGAPPGGRPMYGGPGGSGAPGGPPASGGRPGGPPTYGGPR